MVKQSSRSVEARYVGHSDSNSLTLRLPCRFKSGQSNRAHFVKSNFSLSSHLFHFTLSIQVFLFVCFYTIVQGEACQSFTGIQLFSENCLASCGSCLHTWPPAVSAGLERVNSPLEVLRFPASCLYPQLFVLSLLSRPLSCPEPHSGLDLPHTDNHTLSAPTVAKKCCLLLHQCGDGDALRYVDVLQPQERKKCSILLCAIFLQIFLPVPMMHSSIFCRHKVSFSFREY